MPAPLPTLLLTLVPAPCPMPHAARTHLPWQLPLLRLRHMQHHRGRLQLGQHPRPVLQRVHLCPTARLRRLPLEQGAQGHAAGGRLP